jgi:hypothetical protein
MRESAPAGFQAPAYTSARPISSLKTPPIDTQIRKQAAYDAYDKEFPYDEKKEG